MLCLTTLPAVTWALVMTEPVHVALQDSETDARDSQDLSFEGDMASREASDSSELIADVDVEFDAMSSGDVSDMLTVWCPTDLSSSLAANSTKLFAVTSAHRIGPCLKANTLPFSCYRLLCIAV